MIDSMGIGLIMPVMPDLIISLGGTDLSRAAVWGGLLSAIFAVMQFLFGPVIGSLSDRYGRRPVLILSLFVMSVDYLFMAISWTIWLLLIGRIIGGIAAATQSTATAYMADISKPEEKAQNFGLIGAAFGVGFILGPLLGGLLSELGPRAPFYAAAILAAANLVFGYLILPETVTDSIRRPFTWSRANPFGAFRHVGNLPGLKLLLIVFFIYNIGFFVYPSIWSYFVQEKFGWGATMVGVSLATFGASMALVQGGLIRVIIPRIGEHKTVFFGLCANALAFLAYALVTQGWMIFALVPLTASGVVTGPALQGIMSRAASDDAQGELQGVLTSISATGAIISPLLMTGIFGYFTRGDTSYYLPGAPFLLSMVLVLVALSVFAFGARAQLLGKTTKTP